LQPVWSETLAEDQRATAEELPLRRDTLTLLTYMRDHKVIGTEATGNLPLKAVLEISAQFVDPPVTDGVLDGLEYHVRSEDEIWPLYFCHVLAVVGGLLSGGMAGRWELTPRGQDFLSAPAASQVLLLLFKVWWRRINWAITSPFYFIESTLVGPLANFGIVQTQYEPYFSFGEELKRLSAFHITSFGTKILEKIRAATEPKGR
jgi:hypothetical protein